MKLEFNNLGPIQYGEIDLSNKLTAFVGYNSSGKTYVSQLIWGVYKVLNENSLQWTTDYLSNLLTPISLDLTHSVTIDTNVIDGFKVFINKNLNKIIMSEIFGISDANLVAEGFSLKLNYSCEISSKVIQRSINSKIGKVSRSKRTENSFNEIEDTPDAIRFNIRKLAGVNEITYHLEQITLPYTAPSGQRFGPNAVFKSMDDAIRRMHRSLNVVLTNLLAPSTKVPFFLPSNRTFFPAYYRYIYEDANDRLGKVSMIANVNDLQDEEESLNQIKELSKTRYTKPVAQLIDFLYNIDSEIEEEDNIDLLESIEDIMGGKIEFEQQEGVSLPKFLFEMKDSKKIELHLASSSTNQLASLYLFIKYNPAVFEKTLLILDEPEENLHPENQLKLLDVLIKFADRGNSVLFTTHSPLVANALNNYYMASYRRENGVNDLPSSDVLLPFYSPLNISSSDFGVYFFGHGRVTEYKSSRFGAYFSDFSETENKLKLMTDALRGGIFNID